MNISKSIFVDYCKYPKLARWKVNNPKVYKKIRTIETEEQEENIVAIGQAVEDKVKELLELENQTTALGSKKSSTRAKRYRTRDRSDGIGVVWTYRGRD